MRRLGRLLLGPQIAHFWLVPRSNRGHQSFRPGMRASASVSLLASTFQGGPPMSPGLLMEGILPQELFRMPQQIPLSSFGTRTVAKRFSPTTRQRVQLSCSGLLIAIFSRLLIRKILLPALSEPFATPIILSMLFRCFRSCESENHVKTSIAGQERTEEGD